MRLNGDLSDSFVVSPAKKGQVDLEGGSSKGIVALLSEFVPVEAARPF